MTKRFAKPCTADTRVPQAGPPLTSAPCLRHVPSMQSPWVILKTGSTLPDIARRRGDFEDWIAAGLELSLSDVLVVPVFEGAPLPPVRDVPAVVITGSPAMVTARQDWSVASAAWLRDAWLLDRPILGICYGHQLLADALGGQVARNPAGREIGTVTVDKTPEGRCDPLLSFPEDRFLAQESHSEAVVRLPPDAIALASSTLCGHQAFRSRRAWGVQFHPEFDADVMRGYIHGRADALQAEGLDPDRLLGDVRECSAASSVLRRFRQVVAGQ